MTNEAPYPNGEGSYLAFNIESMPYSTIHVAFADFATVGDAVGFAVDVAQTLKAAYEAGGLRMQVPTAPPANNQQRPAQQQRTGLALGPPVQAGGGGGGGQGASAIAYCKEHRVGVRPSVGRFNRDGDGVYHELPQDQWYRKTPDGAMIKNHSMYWRETVNREGISNQGVPMPGLQGAGPPVRETQRAGGYGGRAPVRDLPERDVDADARPAPSGDHNNGGWVDEPNDLPF